MPTIQQQNKTKRTDKDIQAEVNRGYELVIGLTEKAVEARPSDWRLWMVNGATHFDWAEYAYGKQEKLAIYTEKRDKAFEMLQKAAELYAAQVTSMDENQQTPMVFQQWFNATLGASDLAFLTRQQKMDTNRIDQIRDALRALPEETVERHLAAFGKSLSDSVNGLPPELKPRYLRLACASWAITKAPRKRASWSRITTACWTKCSSTRASMAMRTWPWPSVWRAARDSAQRGGRARERRFCEVPDEPANHAVLLQPDGRWARELPR
jgi:hypothetical protein